MLSHEDHTKTSNYVDIIILFVLFPFRQYRDYKQCIRPLMSGCRKGVQKVLDYDGRLRTYTMKMDYICKDAKTGEYTNYTCMGALRGPTLALGALRAPTLALGAHGDLYFFLISLIL